MLCARVQTRFAVILGKIHQNGLTGVRCLQGPNGFQFLKLAGIAVYAVNAKLTQQGPAESTRAQFLAKCFSATNRNIDGPCGILNQIEFFCCLRKWERTAVDSMQKARENPFFIK